MPESSANDSTSGQSLLDQKALTRRILWKLDIHILPPLALLWLANFIDRSNVGNARIAGLERDLHLHGNQFNIVLAVFYASYLVIEIPSNLILKRMRPDRWLPLLVCCWGIVTTLTGLVQNFGGLIAIRMVLGFCEGGLLPGIILYLSSVYRPHELQLRVGIFYASASLSGAFGGLLASAIIRMESVGGLAGWRWIFILEGIATIICAIIAAYFLPPSLESANFFTDEEREFAIRRFHASHLIERSHSPEVLSSSDFKADKQTVDTEVQMKANVPFVEDEHFEWREVIRGLVDVQVWLTAIAYFGLVVSLYSYSLFLPTIVAGLGYRGPDAQLHTVYPYIPAAVLTVVVAILSDRLKWRGPFILICLPLAIAGYIVGIASKTNTGRYAAVFLMASGVYPCGPCILSILPNNSSGHYKRATTTALQLAVANAGGFVATFSYTQDQSPKYHRGHTIALSFLCLAWILIAANVSYCVWENRARAAGKREDNITQYDLLRNSGKTRAPIGDRHPGFRYTL